MTEDTKGYWPVLVGDLMTKEVISVEPSTTVKDVARLLVAHDIRCVPVVDIGDVLVGVVSEADLISREGFPTARSHRIAHLIGDAVDEHRHHWSSRADGVTAEEVMTPDVVACGPEEPISMVARRLLQGGIRTMPVVEGGRLVGMISRHDILTVFDRPDADVRDAVEHLINGPLTAPPGCRVSVKVCDGVVTLEGSTRFHGDVPVLGEIVRKVPGVVGVTNLVHGREADPRPPYFGERGLR